MFVHFPGGMHTTAATCIAQTSVSFSQSPRQPTLGHHQGLRRIGSHPGALQASPGLAFSQALSWTNKDCCEVTLMCPENWIRHLRQVEVGSSDKYVMLLTNAYQHVSTLWLERVDGL